MTYCIVYFFNVLVRWDTLQICALKFKIFTVVIILLSGSRETLPLYVIYDLGQLLDKIAKELSSVRLSQEGSSPAAPGIEVDLATDSLRCLRNACAACVRNQIEVNRYIV